MNAFYRGGGLLVFLGMALFDGSHVSAAPPAQSSNQLGPRLVYVAHGEPLVRRAFQSQTQPASVSDKAAWKAGEAEPAKNSPDGKYQVVEYASDAKRPEELEGIQGGFRILSGRREVMSGVSIFQVIPIDNPGNSFAFNGWLPDSKHFVLVANSHISTTEFGMRCIVDITTHKSIAFNGWISPSSHIALVSSQERVMEGDDSKDFDEHGKARGRVYTGPKCYLINPLVNLSSYRFHASAGKLLKFHSKPFLLSPWERVELSSDEHWALCNRYHEAFLISLTTGGVTRLPGIHAHFAKE